MPKKKIQHKGKPKHASEESEDYVFGKKDIETTEEEYTTVVDFEANKKYNKRLIESNWSKYESEPLESQYGTEEDEPPKTNDLNYLLEIASSDCAHFEFSSEKLWRSENNSVPASKIFNLDLNILSSGLACVPFHERMGLDESELSAEDRQKFDEDAQNSWQEYNSIREKSGKKSENDSKRKDLETSVGTLEESIKERLDLSVGSEKTEKTQECSGDGEFVKGEKSPNETDIFKSESKDKVEKNKQSIFFSEKDENLEDWLDSVLDD